MHVKINFKYLRLKLYLLKMEAIKLKTKKDTYTDPADANAEPCLAKGSLN